jgi:uncharacterized membrane protein YdbT with pleckstrin-like domain
MRVVAKTGLFVRNANEMRHDKIEEVRMNQSIYGRMLNYGTLVLEGAGRGRILLLDVDDPLSFRKAVMSAIENKVSNQ